MSFIKLSNSKQVVAIHEECELKEKNKEVHHSKKLQKQLLYVEELQQQILDGKIKAEQELEHDQAVINQQTRENEQWLIHEEKRLSVLQQQESAVQTEVKSYAEAGVQNTLEPEICPSLILQNKKKLVQLELLQKYSLKEAERNLRRKEVKLYLERIVKKQKLLEAKKNLERLEASCWISEDNVKHSHPLFQDIAVTSWDCKYPRPGQSSDGSSLQRRRNSFLNVHLPHVPSHCFFLKRDTSNELSTSAHSYRCSQVSPSKKSFSVEYLPKTVKELSRTDNVDVEIDDGSFPTQRQLTEIYKSLCLANKQRADNSISNVISHIYKDYYQMEKTDNRPRQIRPKAQISKSCSPDLFKKKSEPETRKRVTGTKVLGDTNSCMGKHLEKNEDQEISKKKAKYVRNKHQGSLPASSIKELKRSAACCKLPVQHVDQTAKNVKKDPKDKQSEEGRELLRSATSAGSLNKINNEKLSEKRWHSAEVLSVGISKTAPDTLRSWQEDEDVGFSDTDSTYSVDSLSCIYTTVLTEKVRQEESAGIQDTLDLEDSESDDSQMSQDSLTEKVNKPESQDQKCFPWAHQEPVNFYKDSNCQPLFSVLATISTSGNHLTEHERSFSLDSLGDVDEVSEDMAEECKLESFDEVPAELFWGLQNPQLETRNSNEQHNPESSDENIIKKSDDLNFNASSFYLDASTQSGSSSICDHSQKEMKINFSVQGRSLDQRPHAAGENLPISSDAWLSYDLKSGKSNPIIAMPSFQDHSDFQVAQVHPFNTSHNWMKKDELRQSAAELSFVSYKEPHRIAHEPTKIEMLFSSAPPSTPLPETRKHLEREIIGAAVSVFSSAADISFEHVSAFPTKHSYCEIALPPESNNHQPDELAEGGSTDKWKQTSTCLKETPGKNNSSQASEKQDLSVSSIYPEKNEVLKTNSLISTSSMHCLQGEEPHVTTNLEDCIFRTIEKDSIDYYCDGNIKDSEVVDSNTEDKSICTLSSDPPRLATVGATGEKHQCHENLFSNENTLLSNESFYLCDIRSKSQNNVEEEEYSHDKIHLLKYDGCSFDLAQKIRYQQVSAEDTSVDSSAENKLYQMKTTASHHNDQFTPLLQTSATEKGTIHENRDVLTESALEVPSFREVEENKLQDEEWSSGNHFEFRTEALMSKSYSGFIPDCSENYSRQKGLLILDAEHLMRNSIEGKMYNMTCVDLVTDNVICSSVNVKEKKAELSVLDSCSIDDKVSSQSSPNILCQDTARVEKDVCETRSSYTGNNSKETGSITSIDEKHTILYNSDKFGYPGKTKVRHRSLPSSREVNEASLLCMDLKKTDYSGVELCTTQARKHTENNSVKVLENRVFSATTSQAQTPCVNKESEYFKEKVVKAAISLSGENKNKHSSKSVCCEELTKLINSVNKLESDMLEIKSSQSKSLHNYLGIESQSGPVVNRKTFESSSPLHRPSNDHENCERELPVTVTQEETNEEKVQLSDDRKGELCASKATTGPGITFQSSNVNENTIQENPKESECHTTDMKADSERTESAVYCSSTVLTKKTINCLDEYEEPVQDDRVIKTVCASVPAESRQEDTSDCSKEHKKIPPNNESNSCLTESLISPKVVYQENAVDENIMNFETEGKEQSDASEKEGLIGPHTAENDVLVQEKLAYDHMYCDNANDDEIPEKYFVASILEEEDRLQLPVTCLDIDETHRERSHSDVTNKTLRDNSNDGSLYGDRDVIGQCKLSEKFEQADNFENINASITLDRNGLDVYKSVADDFMPNKKEEMHLITPAHLAMNEVLAHSSSTQSMHIFKIGEEERYFKENSERAKLETSQNQAEVLPENRCSYCISNEETLLSEVSEESEWLPHIFSKNNGDVGNDSVNFNQKDLPESINQSYRVTATDVKDLLCQPVHSPLLTGKNRSGENIQDDSTDAGDSSVLFNRSTSDVAGLQYYETQMDSSIQAEALSTSTKGRRDDSDVVVQNNYINFSHELLEQDRGMKADIRLKIASDYIGSEQVPSEDNPCSKSCIAEYHGSLAFVPANDTGTEKMPLTKLLSENANHDLGSSNEKHSAREDQNPEHYLHSVKNIPQKEHVVLGSFGSKTMFPSAVLKENAEEIIQCLPELSSQENFNSINSQKVLDSLLQHNQTNKCLGNTNCTETECETNSEQIISELGRQEKTETMVYRSSHDICERDSEVTSEGGEELLQHSTQTLWENANYRDDSCTQCNRNPYVSEYSASLLNNSTSFPKVFEERKYMNSKFLDVKGDYDVHEEYSKIISNAESAKTQEIVEIYQKEKQEESSFPECLVAVDHTTHSPMDTEAGKCSDNVPLVYGHNMDTKEPRFQTEATSGLLQDNKDVMHFSSSDINPYIHSWQQGERCKIGWKQYVFGSASDVSCNPPPLSLDTQTVMRCSSVDNGLNSENSPFHSHLSSYANARILSSTISSTDDIQGWEVAREGFESTHSDESSKHYSNASHDEHETTSENCVSRCERSQQSGNKSMQVDEIVLLYPSESDVPCSKPQGHLTCERETQTESLAKHKRPKRHRRSYTDISARKPEEARSSFQQPSSWSSVQNLSMHLSQLLHSTSELLGNFSLHTVKDNEQSDQTTKDKENVKASVSDSYTQTTEDIGIQTDILRYPQHKNKENQIKPKMESEPMKSQEVNVIVKVVHTDTVALMKERISDRKGLMLQSMPDLRSHDDKEILEESHVSKATFNKDSSSSLDMQKIPLAAAQTVTLGNPEPSLTTSSFHSQHETSHLVVSKPSSNISLSSASYSQDRKLVSKHGIPETRELYCNNGLFVDRASSPILTLSASPVSRQHSLNKSTSFKGSVGNPRDTANVLTSFRKRESGLLYDTGSQDLHVDTSSQTDSESTTSRDSKEVCKKSENALEKNTAKEFSGIGASKQKHRFTHTAVHTKRLYHSSSTLELSSHGEYSLNDHRETVPVEHSFHQICATRTARNFSGGIKYENPIGNSESSPTDKSFQISLNELNRSSSLKSTESPRCLLDSFSPQCHQTWRTNKSYPCSASEISEMQGDDTVDAESDMESECNTEILLNENTSLVKTHRLRSYSLRDLPVHNKFSNWCGVKGGARSSLTSLTRSTGDIQSPAERRTTNTAIEFQDRPLLGERRTREIERLQRERAQVMSGIHFDMNQPPLTVELTEAKLNYGIGETDAQLRILQNGAGENLTSVPTKQQLYER
ncbi:UNVERIFIED_CONTAM: hypothetical protein K2H54_050065 [Gekko kuhli]